MNTSEYRRYVIDAQLRRGKQKQTPLLYFRICRLIVGSNLEFSYSEEVIRYFLDKRGKYGMKITDEKHFSCKHLSQWKLKVTEEIHLFWASAVVRKYSIWNASKANKKCLRLWRLLIRCVARKLQYGGWYSNFEVLPASRRKRLGKPKRFETFLQKFCAYSSKNYCFENAAHYSSISRKECH